MEKQNDLHHQNPHPCLTHLEKKSKLDHCYLNLPEDMEEDNPLNIENIKEKQDQDDLLQQAAIKHPECYSRKNFTSVADVLCYTKPGDDASIGK